MRTITLGLQATDEASVTDLMKEMEMMGFHATEAVSPAISIAEHQTLKAKVERLSKALRERGHHDVSMGENYQIIHDPQFCQLCRDYPEARPV